MTLGLVAHCSNGTPSSEASCGNQQTAKDHDRTHWNANVLPVGRLTRTPDIELPSARLNEMIEVCLTLVHREKGDWRMEIEMSVDPLLPPILDRVWLQIIINFVMNAPQTMAHPRPARVPGITTSPAAQKTTWPCWTRQYRH